MNHLKTTVVLCCISLGFILAACSNTPPVPVVERSGSLRANTAATGSVKDPAGTYRVKKGDTLYGIALDHGRDYKELAEWNHLENINLIEVNQLLRVAPSELDGTQVAVAKPVTSDGPIEVKSGAAKAGIALSTANSANSASLKRAPKGGKETYSEGVLARIQAEEADGQSGNQSPAAGKAVVTTKATEKAVEKTDKAVPQVADTTSAKDSKDSAAAPNWAWPATGKLLAVFNDGSSKGVDIAGKVGEPVLAAADGTVSYVGTGLRGYGNLVVLRHDATWLSVYAHNSQVLVKEKQPIKRGQKIALMGASDAASPRLHFEIRQQGKPVDPQKLLPGK